MSNVIVSPNQQKAHCEVFFKCLETLNPDGSGSMVDINGLTWTPSVDGVQYTLTNENGLSNNVYSVSKSENPPTTLSAGTWPNFGYRPIIAFACGRIIDPAKVKAPIGVGIISVSNAGGMHGVVYSGTPGSGTELVTTGVYPEKALPAAGADIGLIVEYVPKGESVFRFVDLNGNTFGSGATETKIVAQSLVATDYEVNPGVMNTGRFNGCAWYSIATFSFPIAQGLPSNREDAIRWMLANHSTGNRKLPPHWSYSTP